MEAVWTIWEGLPRARHHLLVWKSAVGKRGPQRETSFTLTVRALLGHHRRHRRRPHRRRSRRRRLVHGHRRRPGHRIDSSMG